MHDDEATSAEFTDAQMHAAVKLASDTARAEAFAAGLPIMYAEQGRLILRHPDGRVEDIGPVSAPPVVSKT